MVEKAYMGKSRAKVWTYTFVAVLLLVGILVVNLAWSNQTVAKEGVKSFLGLPGWSLAAITFAIGALIYWVGLKVETDWPEFLGAFLITASLYAVEMLVGWKHFELGLIVLPYIWPLVVFVVLVMIGMRKSV
jgi:hypothetical protein